MLSSSPSTEVRGGDQPQHQLSADARVDVAFFTATCRLFSADMDAEMDLIQQRPSADSPPQGSAAEAVGGSDSGMQSLARSDSADGSESGLALPFLGQATASTANIMAFSAGGGSGGGSGFACDGSDGPPCAVQNLIGTTVATGSKLQGLDGSPGVFFVFPDLSIRKDGEYRLQFSFVDLRSETGDLITTQTQIQATAFSDAFRVYSAKQFPGMIESTALSKHIARQGVKIPVRKEAGKGGAGTDADL
ncbi:hypothetical protein LPJ61_001440 [Coemansia biformis]|uniref:Velvet domain-containing protein n=1 Tax=Coemansia biformis TaxID=1286918 RepID=A0A9W7YA13_9FUNG|nr:hypothetical protein LPJ61_001440 [Coemansia biformis]